MDDCHAVTSAAVDNAAPVEKIEEPAAAKSEGQLVLERLLAARAQLLFLHRRLGQVKVVIGLPSTPPPPEGGASSVTTTAFFPALRLIADEIEKSTRDLSTDVEDLANGF